MGSGPWIALAWFFGYGAFVFAHIWPYLSVRPSARRRRLWREAAQRAGLTKIQETRDSVVGWAGPVHVEISFNPEGNSVKTEVTVGGPRLPAGLSVRSEQWLDPEVRAAVREVEIGDAVFDAAAWVEGAPAVAHAVLNRPARRALEALCEGRLEVPGQSPVGAKGRLENGILRIQVGRGALSRAARVDRLAGVVERAAALGRLLVATADVPRSVADNLKQERLAGVRLAALVALVREYPDDPATREAALAAREDPEAEIRLRAGIALGPDGRDVLRALAAAKGIADETSAQAVAALAADLAFEEASALLRSALAARRWATARACVAALGRRGGAGAVELLSDALATEAVEVGAAAAAALAATRDPAAEEPLLRALAEGPRDVRLAVAEALGEIGTASSVAPLREAEAAHADLRRAARQAIAKVQARLTGAEPGQLSLAGGEAGALSLADADAGRLSLASAATSAEDEAAERSPEPSGASPAAASPRPRAGERAS